MASDGLRAYLDSRTGAEAEAAVTLRALDAAITAAEPRLVVLRPGSSTLMTWDFTNDDEVDAEAVGDYVGEAVEKHARFRADAKAINERARATAAERMAAHRRS